MFEVVANKTSNKRKKSTDLAIIDKVKSKKSKARTNNTELDKENHLTIIENQNNNNDVTMTISEYVSNTEDELYWQNAYLRTQRHIKHIDDEDIDTCDQTTWLNDINIDLVLEYYADKYNKCGYNIVTMAEQGTNSSLLNNEGWNFDNKPNLILMICYGNHWMMATNIDSMKNTSFTIKRPVFLYDSFITLMGSDLF